MRSCALAITLVALASLGGCRAKSKNDHHAPAFSYYQAKFQPVPIRRVVLLPLMNETHQPHAEEVLRDAMAEQLRAAGLFEVLVLHPHDLHELLPPAPSLATFDTQTLVQLAHQYHADAVLFGSLRSFHPYWPPRIGVTLHLVETSEAMTLASIDGLWDASDESIARQARGYFEHQSPQAVLPQSELVLHGPRYFSNFVAFQITQALTRGAQSATTASDGRARRQRIGHDHGRQPTPIKQVTVLKTNE